jgi:ferric-dicitrate binding protein FerR (iron transport regulator)
LETQEQLQALFNRYLNNESTSEEVEMLMKYFHTDNQTYLDQLILEVFEKSEDTSSNDLQPLPDRVFNGIQTRIHSVAKPVQRSLWPRIAAAASIILAIGAGIFFYASYYAARHPDLSRHPDARRDLLNYANDIAPGKNTATITLANGSTIVLSDAKTGVVVGAESLKYNDGSAVDANDSSRHLNLSRHLDDRRTDQRELNETAKNNNSSELNLLNSTDKRSLPYGRDDVRGVDGGGSRNNARGGLLTATTPRGGTYQITLPDGTKVWLNAASSLKFPASFSSLKTRSVELTGEAYFEVAKDKTHPFIVKTDKQEVQVLGTHFNINAYNDEGSTKTTLLEGSVRVVYALRDPEPTRHLEGSAATRDLLNSTDKRSLPYGRDDERGQYDGKGQYHGKRQYDEKVRDDGASRNDRQVGTTIILKPNEQAILKNNKINILPIDVQTEIAWKEGYFSFNNSSLAEVLTEVARWYNVEVVFEDNAVKKKIILGSVSRYDNLSRVIRVLDRMEVATFKLEGNKLLVNKRK